MTFQTPRLETLPRHPLIIGGARAGTPSGAALAPLGQ